MRNPSTSISTDVLLTRHDRDNVAVKFIQRRVHDGRWFSPGSLCGFSLFVGLLLLPQLAFPTGDQFFGNQPGGKTIGGPSVSILKAGSEKELLSFLRSGPDPFIFVCTTGLNTGSGMVSLNYRTQIGSTKASKFSPGDSMVACGEVTAIFIECHTGQHSQCEFLWRIDVLR